MHPDQRAGHGEDRIEPLLLGVGAAHIPPPATKTAPKPPKVGWLEQRWAAIRWHGLVLA